MLPYKALGQTPGLLHPHGKNPRILNRLLMLSPKTNAKN